MKATTTPTQEQLQRAEAMFARCPHITLERHIEIIIKTDLRNAPKQMTKKDLVQQKIRNAQKEMTSVECQDYFEIQLANQKKLL